MTFAPRVSLYRRSAGCQLLLKLSDVPQRLVHMPGRIKHGVKNVLHNPRRVDDIGDAPGQEAEHRRRAVDFANGPALVAEQDKGRLCCSANP